jgi:cell division protein FtsI (penicillin-binding protein 3)
LQVLDASDYKEAATAQRTSEDVIHAKRGTIYDRDGNILAMSIPAETIYANPSEIEDPKATARVLATVLGGTEEEYLEAFKQHPTFVYIAQKAEVDTAQKLKDKDAALKQELADEIHKTDPYASTPDGPLHGIHYLKDNKRVYPYGSIGAQVIGAVDVDNNGSYGLEKMYDSVLRGKDGTLITEYSLGMENRPLSGQPIPGSQREEIAPTDGQDIVVSIDIELQQYIEVELARMGEERASEKGNVLVLDGATGEIYATASLPLLDRENLTTEDVEKGATTLQSICYSYEPGSIFKAVTAAAVLEEHAMKTEDEIFVPAYRSFEEYDISDSHERPDATMSFRTIIAESSNVGMSLVKDTITNERYAEYLTKWGFGQTTHIDFKGENEGSLNSWEYWSDVTAANISFGQGISVSSLQMASFYGAIANDGIQYRPHFLMDRPQAYNRPTYTGETVMSAQTVDDLTSMLTSVVSDGTGHASRIEGYTVAGKTGTAQKADNVNGGYLPDNYIVSFVGFFPKAESKLVCITSMDNPIGAEGNAPTGPLFASIMQFAANRYMIEPDALITASGAQTEASDTTATEADEQAVKPDTQEDGEE